MALGRTMKYYKSPAGKASYKKKLKKDAERSATTDGKAYRAKHKRMRNAAKKKGLDIKGKDIEKSTGRPVSIKVNRGRLGEGARIKKKRT